MLAAMCRCMKRIEVYKGTDSWMTAQFFNEKPDAECMKWFGTHVLPAAFTLAASAEQVIASLQRLNLDAVVVLV